MGRLNDNTTYFHHFCTSTILTMFSKKQNASTHAVSFARHSGRMNSKTIIFPDSCRFANDVGSASFGGRGVMLRFVKLKRVKVSTSCYAIRC